MPENQTKDLINSINRMNIMLKKSASLKYAFYRGLATGFGGVIGATLLIAIFVWGVSKLEYIPIIGNFVSEIADFVVQNSSLSSGPRITQQ